MYQDKEIKGKSQPNQRQGGNNKLQHLSVPPRVAMLPSARPHCGAAVWRTPRPCTLFGAHS